MTATATVTALLLSPHPPTFRSSALIREAEAVDLHPSPNSNFAPSFGALGSDGSDGAPSVPELPGNPGSLDSVDSAEYGDLPCSWGRGVSPWYLITKGYNFSLPALML